MVALRWSLKKLKERIQQRITQWKVDFGDNQIIYKLLDEGEQLIPKIATIIRTKQSKE